MRLLDWCMPPLATTLLKNGLRGMLYPCSVRHGIMIAAVTMMHVQLYQSGRPGCCPQKIVFASCDGYPLLQQQAAEEATHGQ